MERSIDSQRDQALNLLAARGHVIQRPSYVSGQGVMCSVDGRRLTDAEIIKMAADERSR